MRPVLPALLIASVVVVAPVTTSAAADATCQGMPATVVPDGSGTTTGTEGPDVIVSSDNDVDALGGDDLICVRGGSGEVEITAGAGDDRVYVEGDDPALRTWTVLGVGDDQFVGGPGRDVVTHWLGYDDGPYGIDDNGDDVIRTLGGNDEVLAGGSFPTGQADDVELGEGDDILEVADYDGATGSGLTAASRLVGGPGTDDLRVVVAEGSAGAAVDVDLAQRKVRIDGAVLAQGWVEFESTRVTDEPLHDWDLDEATSVGSVRIRGSAGPDRVILGVGGTRPPLNAALGGGNDSISVFSSLLRRRSSLDGGPGRDLLSVFENGAPARLDLAAGLYTTGDRADRVRVLRFEDAVLDSYGSTGQGRATTLIGTRGPNRLAAACGVIKGGGGNDVLGVAPRFRGCTSFRVEGGYGADRLGGTPTNDVLIGGPGRDLAIGRAGNDRCVAERRVECERR